MVKNGHMHKTFLGKGWRRKSTRNRKPVGVGEYSLTRKPKESSRRCRRFQAMQGHLGRYHTPWKWHYLINSQLLSGLRGHK